VILNPIIFAIAWEEHGETIIRFAAILAALGVIVGMANKLAIKPIIRWGKRVERALDAVESQLLTNNGGSTTKDKLEDIQARTKTIGTHVGSLEKRVRRLEQKEKNP
jgi:hypothetical protein